MVIYDIQKLKKLRKDIFILVADKLSNNQQFCAVNGKPILDDLLNGKYRKETYKFVTEKHIQRNYSKAFEVFLGDLKCAEQFQLKNIAIQHFRKDVTDNAIKVFCNITKTSYEDLIWKEVRQIESKQEATKQIHLTRTDKFFTSYKNQLLKKTSKLEKYIGTYRLYAIENPEDITKENHIITKIVCITQNENKTFEVTESQLEEEHAEGIVFDTGKYITLPMVQYEANGKIKDVDFTLIQVLEESKYKKGKEDKAIFFHSAELSVNYEQNPTLRYVILQRISNEKNDNSVGLPRAKSYSFNELEQLIAAEPNEVIRPELEKIILNLLYKHQLGQARISVPYQSNTENLLDNIQIYNKNLTFIDNVKNILDNQPILKIKEEVSITKSSNTKLYKVIILKEHQAIEYEVTEYEEQIDLGIKESQNFCFENVDNILFTSCWSRIDKRGYSCIIYSSDKHSFPKEDIGNMLMVIRTSVALTNYSVRTDFNRKLAKHVKYNSEQIENHKGNYINFFKCKDEKNNEMIGFNIISLDDNLTIKSKTRRNGKDSVYDGWWIPLSDIIEKKHGSSRASPIVEECQYNGVMLYTFHQDQYNEQRVLLGVGHYTLGKRNKNGDIIGCYSGMSIDDNIASGTDVFLKLRKNDILEAKELYPSSESYNFFNTLISNFDISLLQNDEIQFSLKELLNHYNQI